MDIYIIISLAAFLLIITLLVFIRTKTGNKYEIKNSDIILAILPIVLILLATGKIESFEFGDLKVEAAIVNASNKEIVSQVNPLKGIPVRELQPASKGAVSEIPRLIQNRTEALEFRLGHGGYYGPAIQRYFNQLNQHSLLKYVVIVNPDGSFFGMYDAEMLINYLNNSNQDNLYQKFEKGLNQADLTTLRSFPGLIESDNALTSMTNKSEALSAMEEQNFEFLPVINDQKILSGIVERSRLTASLILDVTQQLSGTSASRQ